MKRLPAAKVLSQKILNTKVKERTLADSDNFLRSRHGELSKYGNVENFIVSHDESEKKLVDAVEFHVRSLRARLAQELWSRQLFIGVSVLDDLIFRAAAEGAPSPVFAAIEKIKRNGLHLPGLLIFPVHSFGILEAGFLRWSSGTRTDFVSKQFGIGLSAQTNSLDDTIEFLERARKRFGVRKRIPSDLISHWLTSRSTKWLTRNPLLIVKIQSFPGGYYENQFALVDKLRFSTALVSMLYTLQPKADESGIGQFSSSSAINNFQTLDIRHYIVLRATPAPTKALDGDCVPMHLGAPALAELSDLGIQINPGFWRKRSVMAERVFSALNRVYEGYLRNGWGSHSGGATGQACRKMFGSLVYFRRSFRKSDKGWSAIVSLAIAFEMLLTDDYASGVTKRIIRRARLSLRGVPGVRRYEDVIDHLYRARGKIVHAGDSSLDIDLHLAQQAFTHVFVSLAEGMPRLSPTSSTPMMDLAGDKPEAKRARCRQCGRV